jgi:DedD protein
MDQQLKARLIGATVLVVLAVLLVPELLSGRKAGTVTADTAQARGTRSYTITLGGGITEGTEALPGATPEPAANRPAPAIAAPAPAQPADSSAGSAPAAQAATEPPIAADPGQPAPAPVARAPEPKPQAQPETAHATPAPPPPAAEPKPAPSKPTQGGYSVQVGAFGSSETARKLVADLRRDGYGAYVAPLERKGKTLHRVRVGPAATRDEADRLAARLKGKGLPATVVSGG